MGKGFKHGAGGAAALNFKVTGNPRPEAPKENTIWINTDEPVTGWVFSPAQPETAEEGMVWIRTGNPGPADFNALKKNALTVCPMSAMQYLEGAWAEKEAKSYRGGAWVSWLPAGALCYFGNDCAATSGGWNARGWSFRESLDDVVTPVITAGGDHMQIRLPSVDYGCGAVEVKQDQDLTNVSSVTIDFELEVNSYLVALVAIDRNEAFMENAAAAVQLAESNTGTFTRRTATLDVGALSGLYDIAIRFVDNWGGGGSYTDLKVYSVIKSAAAPSSGSAVTATDDGAGNVYLSGAAAVCDGSGNVTLKGDEA